MKLEQFVAETARTESPEFHMDKITVSVLHGIIGISTEAGELLDAAKKTLFYGKELDYANIREELGDIMWYMACVLRSLGWDLETIMWENVDKLKKRYPEQWSMSDAEERKDKVNVGED